MDSDGEPIVCNTNGYSARSLAEALASIAGKYDAVYAYDGSNPNDAWLKYSSSLPPFLNTLSELQPGWGYWIRVTEGCSWRIE